MIKRGKRGISPIIATVLLIAFAVSIGAMIMSWGRETLASTGDCSSVKLDVQTMNGKPVLCYDTYNNKINFMIKNNGEVEIQKVKLRVISEDFSIDEQEMPDTKIPIGGIIVKNIDYLKAGTFHLEIIPMINFAGKQKICPEKAVVSDNLPKCNQ